MQEANVGVQKAIVFAK